MGNETSKPSAAAAAPTPSATQAQINQVARQCAEVKVVEVSPNELQTVNDTLSISSSSACIADVSKCPGGKITPQCARACQFVVPANMSTSNLKMYRIPSEIIPVNQQGRFPMSAAKKMFLEPSMPFQFSYNGETFSIGKMSLYHPCPVRIENVQYDAVLQIGEVNAAATGNRNDLVLLIPLAGSNTPDEAGLLIQKLAPFISGLADTGVGDTAATGGTTIDKSGTTAYDQPDAKSRCDTVADARWSRWNVTMGNALNGLKRRVIQYARADGSKWFNKPGTPNGGGGQIIRQYNEDGPDEIRAIVKASGKPAAQVLFTDDAYLFDVYENSSWSDSWGDRFDSGKNWDNAKKLIDRIRAEQDKLAEAGTAKEERESNVREDEFLRIIEEGIPSPDETMTPCEILNVGVGQDWNLTKFMPVGANGVVRVPYFTWKAAKVQYKPRSADPSACVMQYGLVPTLNYTRYIVFERPVRISSADLRSIRSLPAVIPTESGVRFTNTQNILYKNAPPANCTTCDNDAGAKLAADLKKGKVDTQLLIKFLISILSSVGIVIAIYFGLRWAMGTKGDIFKNLGEKVGSYVKIAPPAPNAVNTVLTKATPKLKPLPADTKFTSVVPGM